VLPLLRLLLLNLPVALLCLYLEAAYQSSISSRNSSSNVLAAIRIIWHREIKV
jgi:hypothetical protein